MNLHRPALTTLKILVFFYLAFLFSKNAQAIEYQNCFTNQSCIIGEFLYDDESVPNATASCTITSRYPDGSLFVNAASASAQSNGWYSYSISAGSTEGIYPTQICCTTSSDYLCLDKTFKVKADTTNTSLTAQDVWEYPTRSVTTFGSLISDIWNYNSRSLSNFGSLVADLWNYNNRTVSSSNNNTISSADIKEIKKVTKENRVLLEQLINKPIVKTFIDESTSPNLNAKIEQTKTDASNLYGSIQNLKSRANTLAEKWPTLSSGEVKTELGALSSLLKQDVSQKDTSIIATTTRLKTSWNNPILLNLSDQALAAQSNIDNLINSLNLYPKSNKADAFAPALSHIQFLNDLVGTSLASTENLSLFGFIKKTTDYIGLLDKKIITGQNLYAEIKKNPKGNHSSAISSYSTEVLNLNKLPQADTFLSQNSKNNKNESNKVLGLLALIETNKLLLASDNGSAIKNIWLEEGSIIFRAVATNPSNSLTQNVNIKYYLPTEVKKEQIINFDPKLVIDYDPVESALYASGEVSLAPQETRTFLVEVEDIWFFKQEEIDSLKNQVTELVNLLKDTSQFTPASATKTDIFVTLDKIMLRQSQAITPENRIRTYRESSLDLNGVQEKITSIKELALSAGKGKSGDSGNFRSITLWGIVLLIIAGAIFLMIYLNILRDESKNSTHSKKNQTPKQTPPKNTTFHTHRITGIHMGHRLAKIAVITILTGGLSSIGSSFAIKTARTNQWTSTPKLISPEVLGDSVNKNTSTATESATTR